jgi:excisionase family DNA binding protein
VRRARHARNVRPTEVVPEMDARTLWSLVPRHIQTLVAMDADEVTQNSYKRAFRESRLDLVQRLLDPTLSLEETARLLNVCPTTVRRYTNRGLLTHQRTSGDQRRFKLSDVLAFLEAQQRARE